MPELVDNKSNKSSRKSYGKGDSELPHTDHGRTGTCTLNTPPTHVSSATNCIQVKERHPIISFDSSNSEV